MSTEWPLRPAAKPLAAPLSRCDRDCTYTTWAGTSHRKRGRPMPAKKPAKKSAKKQPRTPKRRRRRACPSCPRTKLDARAARPARTRSGRDRAAARPASAGRSRSSCTRRPSGSWRRSSAAIAATRPRCRLGCPSSPFCAPRKLWRAQYEWYAHVPQAERAGVKPATIRDLHAGRRAEVGPQGRARDLRFHPGALQDATGERSRPTSASTPSSATPPPSSSSASSAITC